MTTVLLWRSCYETDGLAGLFADRPRSGRHKQIPAAKEASIVEATTKTVPKDATHWNVRAMAASQKVSPTTVLRIWKKHKLQPHRVESFKLARLAEYRYRFLMDEQAAVWVVSEWPTICPTVDESTRSMVAFLVK